MIIPPVLYRYRPAGSSLAFLLDEIRGYLWISLCEKLNDPFDGLAFCKREPQVMVAPGTGISVEMQNTWGVACFTETWGNPTMWSHYAGGAHGVCLGYCTRTLLEMVDSIKGFVLKGSSSAYKDIRLDPVRYTDEQPTQSIHQRDAVYQKTKHWAYEREWRLALAAPMHANSISAGGIPFPTDYALKEVLFTGLDEASVRAIDQARKSLRHEVTIGEVSADREANCYRRIEGIPANAQQAWYWNPQTGWRAH